MESWSSAWSSASASVDASTPNARVSHMAGLAVGLGHGVSRHAAPDGGVLPARLIERLALGEQLGCRLGGRRIDEGIDQGITHGTEITNGCGGCSGAAHGDCTVRASETALLRLARELSTAPPAVRTLAPDDGAPEGGTESGGMDGEAAADVCGFVRVGTLGVVAVANETSAAVANLGAGVSMRTLVDVAASKENDPPANKSLSSKSVPFEGVRTCSSVASALRDEAHTCMF